MPMSVGDEPNPHAALFGRRGVIEGKLERWDKTKEQWIPLEYVIEGELSRRQKIGEYYFGQLKGGNVEFEVYPLYLWQLVE